MDNFHPYFDGKNGKIYRTWGSKEGPYGSSTEIYTTVNQNNQRTLIERKSIGR